MTKPKRKSALTKREAPLSGYDDVLNEFVELIESARRASARAVNAVMTATYWEIGRRIVEREQGGGQRAAYGEALLNRIAEDLTRRFGRGFGVDNLQRMRAFYQAWPPERISATASRKSSASPARFGQADFAELARRFPLPWSHYVKLLTVKSPEARAFYEAEALRGGWTVRQLNRQINTLFYERTALSRNKAAMLTKGAKSRPADALAPEEEIKDPLVLEFLGLKDEYSEGELEESLIRHLEEFLLELGHEFTFVGRQKRLRIDDRWFRLDLLLFHRRLRCLLIIDLKLEELTHADVGQMHLYCNYAREHWTLPDENPPVGLILCTSKGEMLARYALDGLPNKVLAAEYRVALPDEKAIAAEIERTRRLLEGRTEVKAKRGERE
jgi:predicted nuclease of restriction endonuclease-like (RecB) superfamily